MEGFKPIQIDGESDKLPEEKIEAVTDSPQTLSFGEGLVAARALERQPALAFERSSKAAETNEPLEGQLERKEIREQPDVQSIGSVIADLQSKQQFQPTASVGEDSKSTATAGIQNGYDGTGLPTYDDGKHTYRQAIVGGFIAAIMTIIFVILLLVIL